MKASMVTMAFTLDGYRIDETLGVVRGIVVRSRSIFGTIGAGLQTLVGGNITLMTELCERARSDAFAQMIAGASKPVYGFVSGDCCSAAYWIGSQCRELSSDPTARLGNIGVMMGGSVQEAPDSEGRRGVNVISSNAPLKRVDLATEEGQASIRAMLDGIEEVFLQAVARGRKVPVSTVKQDFGQGAPMSAKQAKSAGLIDRIEANGLAGALSRLASPVRTATPRRAAAAHQLAHIRAQSLK